MCRWVVYRGENPILVSDLLIKSKHSLIHQSYRSQERKEPLNGDGFGIGWYDWKFSRQPCLFTSIRPAWADRNLERLSPFIASSCLFAHVRAASPGLPITELNCHPFRYKHLIWMHNGHIQNFQKIKRQLRESLSHESYAFIQGNTDSEHIFGLFVDQLPPGKEEYSAEDLRIAIHKTTTILHELTGAAGITETCTYNFAVSDGHSVVATHHSTGENPHWESLYYSLFNSYEIKDGEDELVHDSSEQPKAILIASEPLTDEAWEWIEVPKDHSLTIDRDFNVSFHPISVA